MEGFSCEILSLQSIKIHIFTMMSRSHIKLESNKSTWTLVAKARINIFVLKSYDKLQVCWLKQNIFVKNAKIMAFWLKTQHFGKITAFDENQFMWFPCCRDFLLLSYYLKLGTPVISFYYHLRWVLPNFGFLTPFHFPVESPHVSEQMDVRVTKSNAAH